MAWMERANIVGGAGVTDNEHPGVSSSECEMSQNMYVISYKELPVENAEENLPS